MWSRGVAGQVSTTILLCFIVFGFAGCGSVEPVAPYVPPITDPAQIFVGLTLDHGAVNLSTAGPYDTLQLTATPWNALGDPMTDLPTPSFSSSDTTIVSVTSTGLLRAIKVSSKTVTVTAELVGKGNVRRTATVMVKVTASSTPPQLVSLLFDPPDSTTQSLNSSGVIDIQIFGVFYRSYVNFKTPIGRVRNDAGSVVAGLAVEYLSLDTAVAVIDPVSRTVTRLGVGSARMVVRTTAYGARLADTLDYTLTWPVVHGIVVDVDRNGAVQFMANDVRLAPYGIVYWKNLLADTVDVTFEEPTNVVSPPDATVCILFSENVFDIPGTHCGAGNVLIPGFATQPDLSDNPFAQSRWTYQVRQFPVPGVYRYYSTRTGATGRIVVTTDFDPRALP